MKDIYAVGIGVGAFALGCAAIALVEDGKINDMNNKLSGINGGLRYIQDNVDLTIPEDVAKKLVRDAAQEVATSAVKKASSEVTKEVSDSIKGQVKGAIKDAYKNVETDVRHQLESQINLQTIEKIQNQVSEKVAKQIVDRSLVLGNQTSSKASIIKTCADNGMSAFEIQRILEATK